MMLVQLHFQALEYSHEELTLLFLRISYLKIINNTLSEDLNIAFEIALSTTVIYH